MMWHEEDRGNASPRESRAPGEVADLLNRDGFRTQRDSHWDATLVERVLAADKRKLIAMDRILGPSADREAALAEYAAASNALNDLLAMT
jgi:hypothetical protein